MTLSKIKAALADASLPPTKRIEGAMSHVCRAQASGGEITFLTAREKRFLAVAAELLFVSRELLRIMDTPIEKLVPATSPILPIARAALAKVDGDPNEIGAEIHALEEASSEASSAPRSKTWRCPACGTVATVSAVYDQKLCMSCGGVAMLEIPA